MFELADYLVGIYKTNDCTKSVTINPRAFETPRANTVEEEPNQLNQNGSNEDVLTEVTMNDDAVNSDVEESLLSQNYANTSEDRVINDSFEEQMDVS